MSVNLMSVAEIAAEKSWGFVSQSIERLMIFGTDSTVLAEPDRAEEILRHEVDRLLFLDTVTRAAIRRNDKFLLLVDVLAQKIGSVLSYDTLSRETGLNKTTVASYIRLLEEAEIVLVCPSFSRTGRHELKKGKKIYFCDTGFRNAVLGDFRPFCAREKVEAKALWENFFLMERVKAHRGRSDHRSIAFWRSTGNSPQTIDFVEIDNDKIRAFQCPMTTSEKIKTAGFLKVYPEASVKIVTPNDLMKLWVAPDALEH